MYKKLRRTLMDVVAPSRAYAVGSAPRPTRSAPRAPLHDATASRAAHDPRENTPQSRPYRRHQPARAVVASDAYDARVAFKHSS